jgi:hypothetical protein
MTTVKPVPAELSPPIPSALDPWCDADPLQQAETPHLLAYLATIPDPRAPRGHRHPLIAILAMAAAAVLAGARSMTAIAEWAADTPRASGPRSAPAARAPTITASRPRPPSAGPWAAWTPRPWPRRSGAWLGDRDRLQRQRQWRRAIAVDGKTLRGAHTPDGRQVHLLAAMDQITRTVLAQRQVDGAPGEVPAIQPC